MYQGDSVRLKVKFKSFTGQPINPVDVKLIIYDNQKNIIETITDLVQEGTGQFYYDYVPANELNEFIFEFVGSYQNKPILSRGKVEVKFI